HFLLNHSAIYEGRWLEALKPWGGGMHAVGAIVGMMLAILLVLPRLGIPVLKFMDGYTPTFFLSFALIRVGCWLHGCCFGVIGDWPWSEVLEPGQLGYSFQVAH